MYGRPLVDEVRRQPREVLAVERAERLLMPRPYPTRGRAQLLRDRPSAHRNRHQRVVVLGWFGIRHADRLSPGSSSYEITTWTRRTGCRRARRRNVNSSRTKAIT